jgi:transposase-like protein
MRKNYSKELKAKIVMELLREEETLAQIASKHEIHPNQLTRWRKAAVEGIPELLADKRKKGAIEKEQEELIRELYQQIGELSAKLSWLKKKSGIDIQQR